MHSTIVTVQLSYYGYFFQDCKFKSNYIFTRRNIFATETSEESVRFLSPSTRTEIYNNWNIVINHRFFLQEKEEEQQQRRFIYNKKEKRSQRNIEVWSL